MAEQECNTEVSANEVTGSAVRRLKVSYARTSPDYEQVPSLTMKGKWLAAAGFDTGTVVDVRVMQGCLVLTARPAEPEEPELMKSLRQVCRFSTRKQQQVQAFIEAVEARRVGG